ncbi:MAG: helix-turn-helix domain-containing protein [Candidatus Limnocylindrales bacterium]
MPVRQGHGDVGAADARRIARSTGAEFRETRISLGLSQRSVARAAGISATQLGRLERGEARSPSVATICRTARALGLSASLKLYPAGVPVRDAAHLALLGRFEALLAGPLRMRREVALPIEGDPRAWDAMIVGAGTMAFTEGESRLGDMQAVARRAELKLRDDGRGSVVILIVARTRHNLRVLREHRETLRAQFPLDGAAVARALRAGRIPPASGIIAI